MVVVVGIILEMMRIVRMGQEQFTNIHLSTHLLLYVFLYRHSVREPEICSRSS